MKDVTVVGIDHCGSACKLLRACLQHIGFTDIHIGDSADHAQELLSIHRPGLLIINDRLRDGDGFDVIAKLRAGITAKDAYEIRYEFESGELDNFHGDPDAVMHEGRPSDLPPLHDVPKDTPVLLTTDAATQATVARCEALGVSSLLMKPYTPDLMLKRIKRSLNAQQPLRKAS